jgi:hypothetical protein
LKLGLTPNRHHRETTWIPLQSTTFDLAGGSLLEEGGYGYDIPPSLKRLLIIAMVNVDLVEKGIKVAVVAIMV